MTQSFDEWNKYNLGYVGREAYEAGAQSRQAEIDELKKRIDEALTIIYDEKSKVECDFYQGVNADLIVGIGYDIHLILKGKEND